VAVSYPAADRLRLTWTNNVTATSIVVERATAAGGPFTVHLTLTGSPTTTDDTTNVVQSTQYHYRLRAVVAAQQSNPSAVATATPPAVPTAPIAPGSVTTSNVTATSMRVAWTHPGTGVDGFTVERLINYTGPSFVYQRIADVGPAVRFFNDTCLLPSSGAGTTPYLYRVTAYNAAGRTSATTPNNTFTLAPTAAPTQAPTNLRATAVSANSFRVEWNAVCAGQDRILIERSINGGAFTNLLNNTFFQGDATWFLYTEVPTGQTHVFRAWAGNSVGFSAASATTTIGPLPAPVGSAQSIGVYADYDNTKVYSDLLPNVTNSVLSTGNLTAGCFWLYNSFLGIQNFNCYAAAIHFPLSGTTTTNTSFNLTGRAIDRAVLVLSTSDVAINPTQLSVSAIATPWNTTTLNGATSLNLFAAGASNTPAPGIYGPWAVDVTTIVRNWVSGSANNGVLIEDANFVFPSASLIRTSFFNSTDSFAGDARRRPTLWIDFR
jgi:hypothetical protein